MDVGVSVVMREIGAEVEVWRVIAAAVMLPCSAWFCSTVAGVAIESSCCAAASPQLVVGAPESKGCLPGSSVVAMRRSKSVHGSRRPSQTGAQCRFRMFVNQLWTCKRHTKSSSSDEARRLRDVLRVSDLHFRKVGLGGQVSFVLLHRIWAREMVDEPSLKDV